jgi:ATP-dependent DNA helicase PIF1
MLIKNTDESLVNGSVGKVIGFYDQGSYNKVLAGMGMLEEDSSLAKGKDKGKDKAGAGKGGGKDAAASAGQPVYPLVSFPIVGGGNREMLMVPETWKVELPNGEVQASRTQVSAFSVAFYISHRSEVGRWQKC